MRRYRVDVGARTHVIDVDEVTDTQFRVVVGGQTFDVTLSAAEHVPEAVISPDMADVSGNGDLQPTPTAAQFRPVAPDALRSMVPATLPPQAPPSAGAPRTSLSAPMPGTITSVEVSAGDRVVVGQVLLKLEAMKMVNAIKAPREAVIAAVAVAPGASVTFGQVLVTFEEN
jgi:biotin carboxyl carrier protein